MVSHSSKNSDDQDKKQDKVTKAISYLNSNVQEMI